MSNCVVRARIDDALKTEASAVLKAMGLTVSDAFPLMMVEIAKEKALPFEPQVPNKETIEAMKAARRGELVTVGPPRSGSHWGCRYGLAEFRGRNLFEDRPKLERSLFTECAFETTLSGGPARTGLGDGSFSSLGQHDHTAASILIRRGERHEAALLERPQKVP